MLVVEVLPVARILVIHGPNLNLLGRREPAVYGAMTLEEVDALLRGWAESHHVTMRVEQTNHEGAMIDLIHQGMGWADGLVINPGGYAHSSVALADAVRGCGIVAVEVHLTNIFARESMRRRSIVAQACRGIVAGLGAQGYLAACEALVEMIESGKAVASGPARTGGVG